MFGTVCASWVAYSSQQRTEQDDFPPADVETVGHPAAAPLEGLDSFQNVTNPTETTVDEMSKCGNQLPYLMHFIFYYYLFQGPNYGKCDDLHSKSSRHTK